MLADSGVDAVVIAVPAHLHADLVVAAAAAGKSVFCEKPMALTLADADRVVGAARAAGVVLQVGFNRRFAADWRAARALLDAGRLGMPRLLRSVTRDPGGFNPVGVPQQTIFVETSIHDFDALRFLNPGAEAVEVYATADALVAPEFRDEGLLDTAVVVVRFDNHAVGVAEACFEAVYGYDVRGEVFGSGGMVTLGGGRRTGFPRTPFRASLSSAVSVVTSARSASSRVPACDTTPAPSAVISPNPTVRGQSGVVVDRGWRG